MNTEPRINAELTRFPELRHRLVGAADAKGDTLVHDVLASVSDLHAPILSKVRGALADEDIASRLRGRMDEMEAHLRRIERRAEDKRGEALKAMAEASLQCLKAADLRIKVRRAPPILVVSDESAIPDAYRVARPAWLDYQAIRDALKAGVDVPGAALAVPQPYLSVRTS